MQEADEPVVLCFRDVYRYLDMADSGGLQGPALLPALWLQRALGVSMGATLYGNQLTGRGQHTQDKHQAHSLGQSSNGAHSVDLNWL